MTARMPAAFVTSLALHGLVVAVLLLLAYAANSDRKTETRVFELVAGEGDNFGATEAPALGVPGGIKLPVATPSPPRPEPPKPEVVKPEPQPAKPEPTPVAPTPPPEPATAPVATAEPKKATPAPTKQRTMAQDVNRRIVIGESKAKMQLAREKAAEQKRLEKERLEQAKAAAANSPRVDAEGIAKGVLGGSTSNKDGGAGGKALSRADGPVLDAYFAMLRERLNKAMDKPPGLSDTLAVGVEFRINANGSITGVKIVSPSGNTELDRAVLDAYARVRMPPRPDGKSEEHTMRIRTKDLDGG